MSIAQPVSPPFVDANLLHQIAPKVGAAVRAVLGSAHPDVDDAIQLSLIAFVQAMPAFRGECEPVGYARVIAVRTAIAMKKRARAHALRASAEEPDSVTSGAASPSESAAAEERKNCLRELLTELSNEQAEALMLRVMFGWSIEEIACETDAPINTVRSRLRLAKERLRARIEASPALRELCERGTRIPTTLESDPANGKGSPLDGPQSAE